MLQGDLIIFPLKRFFLLLSVCHLSAILLPSVLVFHLSFLSLIYSLEKKLDKWKEFLSETDICEIIKRAVFSMIGAAAPTQWMYAGHSNEFLYILELGAIRRRQTKYIWTDQWKRNRELFICTMFPMNPCLISCSVYHEQIVPARNMGHLVWWVSINLLVLS